MSSRVPSSSPLSSRQSSEATFMTASPEFISPYQATQLLPFELQQYLRTYLEEFLFNQAFRLLLNLTCASAGNTKKKVLIPSPEYLATISTISVHPNLTTRALKPDDKAQSNLALRLLQTLLKITGPINSNLIEAYRFRKFQQLDNENDEWQQSKLTMIYADAQNIFKCKDDFWDTLGWALNCSCLSGMYAERWSYWQPWLEHMLEVLEIDWELRQDDTSKRGSLIWNYITSAVGGSAAPRRILRAIFADGMQRALDEFTPVFPKELRQPRSDQNSKKQEVIVNIDEGIYGDWVQQSDSTSDDEANIHDGLERAAKRMRTRTPSTRRRKTPLRNTSLLVDEEESDTSGVDEDTNSYTLGSPASIIIRLRLLQLLSTISACPHLQADSHPHFPDLHDLYTLYVEFIRPLPIPVFQSIVMSSMTQQNLSPDARVTMCEFLMQRIVDKTGQPKVYDNLAPMTQVRLVQEYLPFAAANNTVVMQAKLSLLIESVLRVMARATGILSKSEEFIAALHTGIAQRQSRAEAIESRSKHKRLANDEETEAFVLLAESSARLRYIIDNLD